MAVGGCTFSSDDIVIKSPTDRRLYRYIRLQNGLCALLVHDPDIYSDEPHSKIAGGREDEEDEEEEDDEDSEDDEDEDDDSDDDEEESEDDGNQVKVKGTRGASQTKKASVASYLPYKYIPVTIAFLMGRKRSFC